MHRVKNSIHIILGYETVEGKERREREGGREGEREREINTTPCSYTLTHAKGSLNVLDMERNHMVDGLMVSTLGGLPYLVKLPQGSPTLFIPF